MRKTTIATWVLLTFSFSVIIVSSYFILKDRNQGYIGMYPTEPGIPHIPNHPGDGYVGISKHKDSVFTFSDHDSTFQFVDTPRTGFLDAWTVLENLHKIPSHKKKHKDSAFFRFSNRDTLGWEVIRGEPKRKPSIIITTVKNPNWTAYGGNSVNDTPWVRFVKDSLGIYIPKIHYWQIDENKWHLKYDGSNRYKWRWDHIVKEMDTLSRGLRDTYILVDAAEMWWIVDSTTFYKLGN